MAVTKGDLESFIKSTLLYSEKNFDIHIMDDISFGPGRKTRSGRLIKSTPNDNDANPICQSIRFLEEYEFIRMQFNDETQEMNYVATRLGHACLGKTKTY